MTTHLVDRAPCDACGKWRVLYYIGDEAYCAVCDEPIPWQTLHDVVYPPRMPGDYYAGD